MKYFILFLTFIFFSCGNQQGKDFPPTPQDPKDSVMNRPGKLNEDFISVCSSINSANINQFIHAGHGLWIIESPGAMPAMRNVKNIEGKFSIDFSNMIADNNVPSVDCDAKNFWTREGCFAQEADLFADTQIWEHSNLSKEDTDKVLKAAQAIKWTVINTRLNARYYFSLIDGKWYLSFVDLRTPCEA